MNIINNYKRLNSSFSIETNVKSYVPKPTDLDYERGYIKRYFTQKVNDQNSPIIEISSDEFARLKLNPLYKTVSVKWQIRGNVEIIKSANKKSVNLSTKQMKKLPVYVSNLIQFHRK